MLLIKHFNFYVIFCRIMSKYFYLQNAKNMIIYKYLDYKKTYKIDSIEIIKNTDWSYLNKTEENKITLITCVENEPQYRRCVQGTEI